MPSFTSSPSGVLVSTIGNILTLTGSGTSWSGSPFSISGGTGSSVTAQVVNSTTSAVITVTAGSSVGPLTLSDGTNTLVIPCYNTDFPSLPGLLADWDASKLSGFSNGNTVQNFTDASGRGNTSSQATSGSRPIYATSGIGSLPALNYNSGKVTSAAAFLASVTAFTVYVVYKRTSNTAAFLTSTNVNSGFGAYLNYTSAPSANAELTGSVGGMTFYSGFSSGAGSNGPAIVFSSGNNDFGVIAMGYDGSSTYAAMHDGDSLYQVSGYQSASGSATLTGPTVIGQRTDGAFPFPGLIGEEIVCGSFHTKAQMLAQVAALMSKWGVTGPNEAYGFGDSIMVGFNGYSPAGWFGYTSTQLMSFPFYSYDKGISGTNVASADAQGALYCDPYVLPNSIRPYTICVISSGTNDINGTAGEDVTIYNAIKTAVNNRKTANPNVRVLVGTIIARGTFSTAGENHRQLINSYIRTQSSPPWDGIIDLARTNSNGSFVTAPATTLQTSAFFDNQSNTSNTTYYNVDTIHPTSAGDIALAPTAYTAYTAVLALLSAGTVTNTAYTSTTANMSCTAAYSGAGGYTYQWYRSTSSGTLGSPVSGATSLTLADTGLTPNTAYYYSLIVTDSSSATNTSNQVGVTTLMSVTSYSLTGPTTVVKGTTYTYTLTGTGTTSATVTPAASLSGTFSPTTVNLNNTTPVTFTFTPTQFGNCVLSTTNNGGLPDPSSLNLQVSNTGGSTTPLFKSNNFTGGI